HGTTYENDRISADQEKPALVEMGRASDPVAPANWAYRNRMHIQPLPEFAPLIPATCSEACSTQSAHRDPSGWQPIRNFRLRPVSGKYRNLSDRHRVPENSRLLSHCLN